MLEFMLITVALASFFLGRFYASYGEHQRRRYMVRMEACTAELERMTQEVCKALQIAVDEDRLDFLVSMVEKRPDEIIH